MGTFEKTLVVGDIHGCFDELQALIQKACVSATDRVVAVGDLVDRGPKSFETVAWFARDPVHRHALRGNHEGKHLACIGRKINSLAGRIVRTTTTESNYLGMLDYFEQMPFWLDLESAMAVHAGFSPHTMLEEQIPEIMMGMGSSRREGFDGKSTWWFEQSGMPTEKPIIFGHEKHAEGIARGTLLNVWGIDTGASVGGCLTGLLLPTFELVQVPCPNYWESQKKYWQPKIVSEDMPQMAWKWLFALRQESVEWPIEIQEQLKAAYDEFDAVSSWGQAEALCFSKQNRLKNIPNYKKKDLIQRFEQTHKSPEGQLITAYLKGMDALDSLGRYAPTPGLLRERFGAVLRRGSGLSLCRV